MKTFVAAVVGVLFASGAAFAQGKPADGQAAYDALKCGTCHQVAGKGGKLAAALDGVATKRSAADIKSWLTDPAKMEAKLEKKPKMLMSGSTAYKTKKITPADVDNLAAYLATLK
jgi:mono/diheme cytochrome c family protein